MKYADIGEKIRVARKKAGLNQEELAELARLHRISIARYESGTVEPGINAIMRIAEALGITVDELLGNQPLPDDMPIKPKTEDVRILVTGLNKMPKKDVEKALSVMKLIFTEYADYFTKGPEDDDSQL